MENFDLLADRVSYLLKRYNLNASELGRMAGVKPSSVFAWMSGKTKRIGGAPTASIAKTLGISASWLATGKGMPDQSDILAVSEDFKPKDNKYVQIEEYQIEFGCGPGREPTYEELEDGTPVVYKLSWFQQRRIKPENCKRFVITGSSMEPLLYDGDCVLVDLSDTEPIKNNHVYAICLDNELKVKRLIKATTGKNIIIKSDNKDVPPVTLSPGVNEDGTFFRIIGRVVDCSGEGGL